MTLTPWSWAAGRTAWRPRSRSAPPACASSSSKAAPRSAGAAGPRNSPCRDSGTTSARPPIRWPWPPVLPPFRPRRARCPVRRLRRGVRPAAGRRPRRRGHRVGGRDRGAPRPRRRRLPAPARPAGPRLRRPDRPAAVPDPAAASAPERRAGRVRPERTPVSRRGGAPVPDHRGAGPVRRGRRARHDAAHRAADRRRRPHAYRPGPRGGLAGGRRRQRPDHRRHGRRGRRGRRGHRDRAVGAVARRAAPGPGRPARRRAAGPALDRRRPAAAPLPGRPPPVPVRRRRVQGRLRPVRPGAVGERGVPPGRDAAPRRDVRGDRGGRGAGRRRAAPGRAVRPGHPAGRGRPDPGARGTATRSGPTATCPPDRRWT